MNFDTISGGITAFLAFLGMSTPLLIIGLIYYFKKRLEHKQILAAIDKGTPLSELRPPAPPKTHSQQWISYVTKGIALLLIGGGLLAVEILFKGADDFVISIILLSVGTAFVIGGNLKRMNPPTIKNGNGGGNNNLSSSAAVENQ